MPRALVVVVGAMALAGCFGGDGGNDPLPVPDEPVMLSFWDDGETRPRAMMADRVTQSGERYREARFEGVRLRMPLEEGEIVLNADLATVHDGDGGRIVLEPPIRFSGVLEGQALIGRARGAVIRLQDTRLDLEAVEWVVAGQRIRIDALVLRDQWRTREATNPRAEPATAPLAAALACMPAPVAFPAWQRDR